MARAVKLVGVDIRPVAVPEDVDDPRYVKASGMVELPSNVRWSGPPKRYKPPTVLFETSMQGVARITLNRPGVRNAQDTRLLYELNDTFDRAAQDDDVSVIVLAANGPHFSSGHDLRETDLGAVMSEYRTVGTWYGFECAGAEAQMAREKEIYLGFSERWRNIPKPTIAEVHGRVIAGGLMLVVSEW